MFMFVPSARTLATRWEWIRIKGSSWHLFYFQAHTVKHCPYNPEQLKKQTELAEIWKAYRYFSCLLCRHLILRHSFAESTKPFLVSDPLRAPSISVPPDHQHHLWWAWTTTAVSTASTAVSPWPAAPFTTADWDHLQHFSTPHHHHHPHQWCLQTHQDTTQVTLPRQYHHSAAQSPVLSVIINNILSINMNNNNILSINNLTDNFFHRMKYWCKIWSISFISQTENFLSQHSNKLYLKQKIFSEVFTQATEGIYYSTKSIHKSIKRLSSQEQSVFML